MSNYIERLVYKLSRRFTEEEVEFIIDQLEAVMVDYNVEPKTRALAATDNGELVMMFLKAKELQGLSENSIRVYFSKYKHFCSVVNKSLYQVTTDDIRAYLCSLDTSRATVNNTKDILMSLFKWLKAARYIDNNPVEGIGVIKYVKNKRQPLTHKELEELRYACRNDVRRAAIIEFFYSTGCRVGEVEKVTLDDIDWEQNKVTVKGKGGKVRTVPLTDNAQNALKRYMDQYDPETFLFYRKGHKDQGVSKDGYEYIVECAGKAAGFKKKLIPHVLRHTLATHLLQKGAPLIYIQFVLGHARPDTTEIYADVDPTQVLDSVRRLII